MYAYIFTLPTFKYRTYVIEVNVTFSRKLSHWKF